ncbi:hypothetical protein P9051_32190, partial [Bacillus cereus]|nr:hypothetical protein [Bacillus cereus]
LLSKLPPLLGDIQLQRLESPVISLSRSKQKALQGRELQCPAILSKPLPLLNLLLIQERT